MALQKVINGLFCTAVGLWGVYNYLGSPMYCEGPSMLPTIRSGDVVWRSRIGSVKNAMIGDIINFYTPTEEERRTVTKRIIAKEGYNVNYNDEDHYITPGHIWVEGDNRKQSIDSKAYGSIPMNLIQGKITYRIWPNPGKLQ